MGRNTVAHSLLMRLRNTHLLLKSAQLGIFPPTVIEGHVPPADIRRLLAERPDAVGLTVPGMPYGSPGMGPESEREAYSVFLIGKDGTTEVFNQSSAPASRISASNIWMMSLAE